MGGLVGELICTNYTFVDLSGTTANGVSLTAESATGSMGGILGHTFKNCHVKVNGSFSGTVKSGAASLGGLIYNLEGRLDADSGTSVDGLNLTSSGSMRGILLADGKKALVTVSADPGGFDAVTADGFDLLVGENVTSYTTVDVPATGGIVTIETQETDVGKFPEASGWYGLINSRQNTKTRYYFNVATITPPATAGMIASPTDLLYWNIYDFSNTALIAGVKNEYIPSQINDITATADVDMTNYCFYPTAKESVTVDFKGHTLTFGQDKVTAQNQFYGLQAGLLSDIIASDSNRTVTVQDVKLNGTVAYLNGGASGSGALICGTVHGSQVDTNVYTATLNLSNVVLNGVAVEGNASSLLLNRIGSHVQSTIDGVSQSGYAAGTKVASSLIGKGGYNEGTETAVVLSQDIYVT
ncbi:MAG: hypothetical protein PUD59_06740, partial [bacterium]|nr:hypothetical protein [bacterium]